MFSCLSDVARLEDGDWMGQYLSRSNRAKERNWFDRAGIIAENGAKCYPKSA